MKQLIVRNFEKHGDETFFSKLMLKSKKPVYGIPDGKDLFIEGEKKELESFQTVLKASKIPFDVVKMIVIVLALALSSCATVAGGKISDCQKHKPVAGEAKRKIRPVPLVLDIVGGAGLGLIIDFADGAIYKPCNKK